MASNRTSARGQGVGIGTWLLLAAAIVALLWLTVPSGILQLPTQAGGLDLLWPLHYQAWLIFVAVFIGLVLWGLFALFIYRRTMAVLRTRPGATFAWVPSRDCDPSPEKVDRLGRQIAGIPQPVMHWADWRATAVRFQMLSIEGGKVLYTVQVPDRMTPGLRTALEQVDCAELKPITPPVWLGGAPVRSQDQVDE
jgi:hypothetical protein